MIIRFVVMLIGLLVSIGFFVVSGWLNFEFAQALGRSETEGFLIGFVSICADGFKIILPFLFFAAFKERQFARGVAALLMWVVFTGYSLTSSLGFAALNRDGVSGDRQLQAAQYQNMVAAFASKTAARKGLEAHKPITVLEADIRAKQQNRRWSSTTKCTDATSSRSRKFCTGYFALVAQLATAKEAGQLDDEIAALGRSMGRFDGAAVSGSDPQVDVLDEISGLGKDKVRLALIIMMAVLVELGSGLGLFVTFGRVDVRRKVKNETSEKRARKNWARDYAPRVELAGSRLQIEDKGTIGAKVSRQDILVPKAVSDEASDEVWAIDRLIHDPDASVALRELHEDYNSWCRKAGKGDAMKFNAFRNWLEREGFERTQKRGNRLVVLGLRLKSPADTGSNVIEISKAVAC